MTQTEKKIWILLFVCNEKLGKKIKIWINVVGQRENTKKEIRTVNCFPQI